MQTKKQNDEEKTTTTFITKFSFVQQKKRFRDSNMFNIENFERI